MRDKAELAGEFQHLVVARKNEAFHRLQAAQSRRFHQLGHQHARNTAALPVVIDNDRELAGAIARLDIHGRYLVTMTAAQGLGSALGPALAATLIREGGDYSLIMPMAALLCLFGTLMFLFIVWRSAQMGATKAA